MACFSPQRGYQSYEPNANGKRPLLFGPDAVLKGSAIEVACGQCIGCRLDRKRDSGTRIALEAKLHARSCFATFTYSDDHLPRPPSLDKRIAQRLQKSIRKKLEREGARRVRFVSVGEYGELSWRPHYHFVVFGWFPRDAVLKPGGSPDRPAYTSKWLSSVWPYGWCEVCPVTDAVADYIGGYVVKKLTGERAAAHYRWVDPDTGEVHQLEPEFRLQSNRPGIGAGAMERWESDFYPSDQVVGSGGQVRGRPPKYFDRLLERKRPELLAELKAKRKAYALEPRQQWNSSRVRREVRAEVARARLKLRRKPLD